MCGTKAGYTGKRFGNIKSESPAPRPSTASEGGRTSGASQTQPMSRPTTAAPDARGATTTGWRPPGVARGAARGSRGSRDATPARGSRESRDSDDDDDDDGAGEDGGHEETWAFSDQDVPWEQQQARHAHHHHAPADVDAEPVARPAGQRIFWLNTAVTKLHNVRAEPIRESAVVGHLMADTEVRAVCVRARRHRPRDQPTPQIATAPYTDACAPPPTSSRGSSHHPLSQARARVMFAVVSTSL